MWFTNEMALAFICDSFLSAPSGPLLRLSKLVATKEARPLVEALPIEVFKAYFNAQLWAPYNLHVSMFNNFAKTYRIEFCYEHQWFLSAIKLESLKEKVEGKRLGFGKSHQCFVVTMPSKYLDIVNEKNLALSKLNVILNGLVEDEMVVGSLDLNRTPKLPDQLCGSHPSVLKEISKGLLDYLSNVCVTKAIQRNGVDTKFIKHA
ncbi:hypothetical protein L7F22_036352 [Adiantum nelumboides]|nr:hypothetical protein [Adiantum nelumboides]